MSYFNFCGGRGSASNTLLFLGAVSLAGSFYLNNNGDTKNAMFLCAGSAILFLISWFMNRSELKAIVSSYERSSELDSIYRDLDNLSEKIAGCKKDCCRKMNEEMDGVNRRIDKEFCDIKKMCKTNSYCKKELLNEG